MPCPICSGCAGPYPGPARLGITIQREDEMRADKRYYVTADRSRVVDEDDQEAAYLLASEGDDISTEDARRYKLGRYADPEPEPVKAAEQPAEAKMVESAPENKAQRAPAKKDDK